jgi:hypothetical protein
LDVSAEGGSFFSCQFMPKVSFFSLTSLFPLVWALAHRLACALGEKIKPAEARLQKAGFNLTARDFISY